MRQSIDNERSEKVEAILSVANVLQSQGDDPGVAVHHSVQKSDKYANILPIHINLIGVLLPYT